MPNWLQKKITRFDGGCYSNISTNPLKHLKRPSILTSVSWFDRIWEKRQFAVHLFQQSNKYSDLFMQYFIISWIFDEVNKRVIDRPYNFLTVGIGLHNIKHLSTYSFLHQGKADRQDWLGLSTSQSQKDM